MNLSGTAGADIRKVAEGQVDDQPMRIITAERCFKESSATLWCALTEADRIAHWFVPISGDLRLGGRYDLPMGVEGTIVSCQKFRGFRLSWEQEGQVSWVEVNLEQGDDSTRLRLVHSIPKDRKAEQHWRKYGAGATGIGWDLSILGLVLYLDEGLKALDREVIDKWLTSDGGREFIESSATAWRIKQVESGESPEIAKEMADHAYRFYTGT